MTTNDFLILFLVFSNILLIVYCSVIFFQVYIRDRNTKEDNTDNPTPVKETETGIQCLMEDSKDFTDMDYLADFMLQSTEEQWEDYKAKFFIPRRSRNKSGFTINTETLTILRNVLRDTKAETTLTAYIENILTNHLKAHQELINEIADKQKLKKPYTCEYGNCSFRSSPFLGCSMDASLYCISLEAFSRLSSPIR